MAEAKTEVTLTDFRKVLQIQRLKLKIQELEGLLASSKEQIEELQGDLVERYGRNITLRFDITIDADADGDVIP